MSLYNKEINNKVNRNLVGLAIVFLSMVGCASQPASLDMSPDADVTFDGLREVKHSAADKAWAKPGVQLSGYSKIMIQGAGIEYRPGGETSRSSRAASRSSEFALTEKQKARFREVVGEVFLDELAKSERFTLVNEPGQEVLIVRGALLDVVSFVPPDRIGRSDIYLSQVGAVTLVLEIRDSMTDAIFVRAVDRDAIGDNSMAQKSSRSMNTAEVKQTVRRWGALLRTRLDSFSGYSSTSN
jgi:hypothetical protein